MASSSQPSAVPAELPHESLASFEAALERIHALAIERQRTLSTLPTIAEAGATERSLATLPRRLPVEGKELGLDGAMSVLFDEVLPALAQGHAGPRYFGFVTGGTLPSALLADMATSMLDNNVQVHLPRETLATVVEKYALDMVLDVMHLDKSQWTGTFTTGATTSNMLALTCARQATVQKAVRIRRQRRREERAATDINALRDEEELEDWDVGLDGMYGPDVPPVKVFVCQAHASIKKSVAALGIGRRHVHDLGQRLKMPPPSDDDDEDQRELKEALARAETLDFDLASLEAALEECQANAEAAIVIVGMGEVVTGALSDQTLAIRLMCDKYGAWLHMDAAFSAFVCLHDEYHWLSTHMSVCDSLTSDAHKTLNVPYDCGILFVKKHSALRESTQFLPPDESQVFTDHTCYLDDICTPTSFIGPGGPAVSYLTGGQSDTGAASATASNDLHSLVATLPNPLHRNLENSRRFRALPVYISLLSQGHRGTREMVERQLAFAARIRDWLRASPYYQVLTPVSSPLGLAAPTNGRMRAAPGERNPPRWEHDYWATTIVLFRAHPQSCPVAAFRDPARGHARLIDAVKNTRAIYVSPGGYCGLGAVRLAVSNWYTGVNGDEDFNATTHALSQIMEAHHHPDE